MKVGRSSPSFNTGDKDLSPGQGTRASQEATYPRQEAYETWVRSLGQEDSLEEGMATHSPILAWRIPWTEEPGGPQSIRSQRVGHD